MNKKLKKLTAKEIRTLKKYFETYFFKNEFDVLYEAQIPNFALVLLNGSASFQKKNKVKGTVPTETLLGLNHLLTNSPSKLGLKLDKDSEVLLINKSLLLEVLEDEQSEPYKIFKAAM